MTHSSTISGLRFALFGVTVLPAAENTRSDFELAAGKWGDRNMWFFAFKIFSLPVPTRPGTRTFLQVPDPSRPEVKNPYPSDPGRWLWFEVAQEWGGQPAAWLWGWCAQKVAPLLCLVIALIVALGMLIMIISIIIVTLVMLIAISTSPQAEDEDTRMMMINQFAENYLWFSANRFELFYKRIKIGPF